MSRVYVIKSRVEADERRIKSKS